MSVLKEIWLRFPVSDSQDVVTHKLYIEESPGIIVTDPDSPNLSQSFDIGNNRVDIDGIIHGEVNLSVVPGLITLDAIYNIGVAAVDRRGNEAPLSFLDEVPLDFQAPNPVGALIISDS